METTLNKIKAHNPCKESWVKFLKHKEKTEADDEPVKLTEILEVMGIKDAIWCLKTLEGRDREIRLFACDCAESVLHLYEKEYPNDSRVRDCIEAARKYAIGEIDIGVLRDAWTAASAAAWDARAAAWAAARAAAWDAWTAASDARAAETEKQKELFIKYFG